MKSPHRAVDDTVSKRLPTSSKSIDWRLPNGAGICATGLVLPNELTLDQWKAVGIELCKISGAVQFAIGDWWIGRHSYDESEVTAVIDQLPYKRESLMNFGWVAGKVRPSLRNEAVDYNHHVAVAPLKSEEDKTAWLARAAKGKWSVPKLREAIQSSKSNQSDDDNSSARLEDVEPPDHPDRQTERWLEKVLQQAQHAVPTLACLKSCALCDVPDYGLKKMIEVFTNTGKECIEFVEALKVEKGRRSRGASLQPSDENLIAAGHPNEDDQPAPSSSRRKPSSLH